MPIYTRAGTSTHASYFFLIQKLKTSNNIVLNIIPTLHEGYQVYSISAHNGYGKSSCWPWQHPGGSPTYILHNDKTQETREHFFVKLSTWFSSHKPCYKWNRINTSNENVSDVPRSLQSWVSTIQTAVLTADVFQLFTYKNFYEKLSDTWLDVTRVFICSSLFSHDPHIHVCAPLNTLAHRPIVQIELRLPCSLGYHTHTV